MNSSIAIIEPIGGHGGNDIYDFNLIRSINRQNQCNAVLYTCDKTLTDGMRDVKQTYNNIFGKTNKVVRAFNYLKGTLNSLLDAKKNKASLIHLHFFGFSNLEYFNLYLAKKLFGFPVVGTVHDVESFEKYAKGDAFRHDYEKFLSLLDGIVVHTDYARRELLKQLSPDVIDVEKIRTIYACDLDYEGLDSNRINKDVARAHLGLPADRKIILFFGQIKKVKGLDLLLQAMADVCKKDSSVLLVIAGKVWKDDFSGYMSLINRYGLEPRVEQRIGYINNEDVPYYFHAADVIALPYRKIYNSGVLIRAMSFGTPVVASDFGPFEEFIQDGENGYLFETGNVENLAVKLGLILDNPNVLSKMSDAEKAFIKQHFALEKIGEQYRQLYMDILKGKT